MVEFALLLPLLLVLLLAVADFGRVFEAGIVTESAARAAAEAAAIEYVRTEEYRSDPGFTPSTYYAHLHEVAAAAACEEARILPNTTYLAGPPVSCPQWPAVLVCVHDDDHLDPLCDGTPPAGFSGGPSECTAMSGGWSTDDDSQGNDYVETRVCYHFTTLFNLHLAMPLGFGLNLGDVYLQQRAVFNVANY
jgi:hypothetical protein